MTNQTHSNNPHRKNSYGDYVVGEETGAEGATLPMWASDADNPLNLDPDYPPSVVSLRRVDKVTGAFQLSQVFSAEECRHMIDFSERLGYHKDAAISLSRQVRHNQNVVWIANDSTCDLIWRRIDAALSTRLQGMPDLRAFAINGRFRFYRYDEGDFFKFHGDGNWTNSRINNGALVSDAYPGCRSQMSVIIALNAGYSGGATRFRVNADDPFSPVQHFNRVNEVDVYTAMGDILCFPHGYHPMHWMHSGEPVLSGTKYILRTDLFFNALEE